MFENLKSDKFISKIINLYEQIDEAILFHNKSQNILRQFSEIKLLFKIFELNLLDNNFLLKKWLDFEIPHLNIYQDGKIELKYHFFSPCSSGINDNAAYLIHHHGNNTLSSYVFIGSGYNTLHFRKKIINNNDGSFNLVVDKLVFHKKGNVNIVPSWVPHLVSNVESITATIVLWSQDKEKSYIKNEINEIRTSFFYENGKFIGIDENEFVCKTKKIPDFKIESEKHIILICYLMQQLGYSNYNFLEKIVSNIDTPKIWVKYLNFLINGTKIQVPIFNMKINTLNKEIELNKIIQ